MASLVTGIASVPLGCLGVVGILAVVFGIIGLTQVSRRPMSHGKGLAITGLILGSVTSLAWLGYVLS